MKCFLCVLIYILFLKLYKPYIVTNRNKKKIILSINFLKKNNVFNKSFFLKKVYNNHKFVNNGNCVLRLNDINTYCGFFILMHVIRVFYKNSFVGFFKYSNGSICIKSLNYGFSFYNIYDNSFYSFLMKIHDLIYLKVNNDIELNNFFLFIFSENFKFFSFRCLSTKKVYGKSAGVFCSIRNKDFFKKLLFVRLPSKLCIFTDFLSSAITGRVSNIYFRYSFFSSFSEKKNFKKKKQTVRGIAMNPVDHPNGGRSKVKKPFKNPWGLVAKKNK